MKFSVVLLATAAVVALSHVDAAATPALRQGAEPLTVVKTPVGEGAHGNQNVNIFGGICYRWPDQCFYGVNGEQVPKESTRAILAMTVAEVYAMRESAEPAVVPQSAATESAVAGQNVNIFGGICYRWMDQCFYGVNGQPMPKESTRAILGM